MSGDIAVKLVTSAEVSYREAASANLNGGCSGKPSWRRRRVSTNSRSSAKSGSAGNSSSKPGSIGLLDKAESLRRATNIRAYAATVQAIVAIETASISAEELLRRSKWALAAADRIDPVRSARFIRAIEIDGNTNKVWA